MGRSLSWRSASVGLAVLAALVYLTPSLTADLPGWWSHILPKDKISLGLDLQGGIHLVLEVEVDKAVESHLERTVEELKADMRKEKLRYQQIQRADVRGLDVTLMRQEDIQPFTEMMEISYPDYDVKRGPDRDGQPVIELALVSEARKRTRDMAVDQALGEEAGIAHGE